MTANAARASSSLDRIGMGPAATLASMSSWSCLSGVAITKGTVKPPGFDSVTVWWRVALSKRRSASIVSETRRSVCSASISVTVSIRLSTISVSLICSSTNAPRAFRSRQLACRGRVRVTKRYFCLPLPGKRGSLTGPSVRFTEIEMPRLRAFFFRSLRVPDLTTALRSATRACRVDSGVDMQANLPSPKSRRRGGGKSNSLPHRGLRSPLPACSLCFGMCSIVGCIVDLIRHCVNPKGVLDPHGRCWHADSPDPQTFVSEAQTARHQAVEDPR